VSNEGVDTGAVTTAVETAEHSARPAEALVVRTDPLGGSPLAKAAIAEELPAEWIPRRPSGRAAWTRAVEDVRARFPDASWASDLADAIRAGDLAATRLTRVIDARGVLVTTGQQPGLFGGPVYTWSKALSALAIADAIERETGVPACPLFWGATDDSDFAEGAWTAVALPGGASRLSISTDAPAGIPMSEIPLGDVREQIEQLERAAASAMDSRPLEVARHAYRTGATVGGAYLELLRGVMHPLGIPVLDASHHAVRARAHGILQRALSRADAVATAVRQRNAEIVVAGFTPQVAEVEGLSLVFVRDEPNGPRRRVTLAEASRVPGAARPGALSPNVLLRPVVERAILPTVSYVAGPGELSYFAQVSAVAAALEVDTPRALPRWSTTIIEPHVAAILTRFGIAADDLRDPHAVAARVARDAMPATARAALEALRRETRATIDGARRALTGDRVPLPQTVIDGVDRDVGHRVDRFERRVVAAMKRREQDRLSAVNTAGGALFPLGIRQERALNLVPLLARHGRVLLEMMRDAAQAHARSLVK
jgi:bacillithiol synthase